MPAAEQNRLQLAGRGTRGVCYWVYNDGREGFIYWLGMRRRGTWNDGRNGGGLCKELMVWGRCWGDGFSSSFAHLSTCGTCWFHDYSSVAALAVGALAVGVSESGQKWEGTRLVRSDRTEKQVNSNPQMLSFSSPDCEIPVSCFNQLLRT